MFFRNILYGFQSIVIVTKRSGCDKKMPHKNGRKPFGHKCGMLTFGMKSFLLKFRTKNCLKPVEREAGLRLGNGL